MEAVIKPGTVCEVQHYNENLLRVVEVIHYHNGMVWLYDIKGCEDLVWSMDDVDFHRKSH